METAQIQFLVQLLQLLAAVAVPITRRVGQVAQAAAEANQVDLVGQAQVDKATLVEGAARTTLTIRAAAAAAARLRLELLAENHHKPQVEQELQQLMAQTARFFLQAAAAVARGKV